MRTAFGTKEMSRPTIPGRTEDHLPLLPSGPGGVRQPPRRPRILGRLGRLGRRLRSSDVAREESRCWRRGWDLNPRYRSRYTRFPVVHLQPLGHLSNYSGGSPPPEASTAKPSDGTVGLRHPRTPVLTAGQPHPAAPSFEDRLRAEEGPLRCCPSSRPSFSLARLARALGESFVVQWRRARDSNPRYRCRYT